ncbi:hypothetical protein [Acidithiobacillus albertensis]|uniref:hypothetical protein n=1 Tax=Acidithiobacillus albertensis TaxID=119978 RepID=UPI00094B13B4|nr:hypothetical protein [Acidithiobacillus albertensis]
MEILAWLVAAIIAVWSVRRVSKAVLFELWKIPAVVWADFRHSPQVACIPLRLMSPWDVPLFLVGIVLWLSWVITFALTLFWQLTPLVFLIFEAGFLILAIPRAYNDSSVKKKLQGMCVDDGERLVWLALFERTHPDLAKMNPLFFSSIEDNIWRFFAAIFIVLFPLFSLALQLILSGLAVLAVQGLIFLCGFIVSIIPLARWAGSLIGGRYAWWLEYHLLVDGFR